MATPLLSLTSPLSPNINPLRSFLSIRNTAFPVACTSSSLSSVGYTHICRAASDFLQGGVPTELDSKFVSLNADDPQYGPPALLLLGFDIQETTQIKELLKSLAWGIFEGIFEDNPLLWGFFFIIHCTEDMISRSLWEAIHSPQPDFTKVKIAKSVPRICFLSGLTGEEMMMFIDAFPESGLGPAVFAALVPNNGNKILQELIDEVMGDHEMVTARESGSI